MLQKLEKEIDDVDNKIGNRWRLLDRSVWNHPIDLFLNNLAVDKYNFVCTEIMMER